MNYFFLFLLRVLEVVRERSHLLQKNLKGFGSVKQLANEKAYMLLIPMHLQISCLQDSLHI